MCVGERERERDRDGGREREREIRISLVPTALNLLRVSIAVKSGCSTAAGARRSDRGREGARGGGCGQREGETEKLEREEREKRK